MRFRVAFKIAFCVLAVTLCLLPDSSYAQTKKPTKTDSSAFFGEGSEAAADAANTPDSLKK